MLREYYHFIKEYFLLVELKIKYVVIGIVLLVVLLVRMKLCHIFIYFLYLLPIFYMIFLYTLTTKSMALM